MSNSGESEIQSMLENLGTNPEKGLSEVEAYDRLRRFGTNELERPYLLFQQVKLASLLCFAVGIVMVAENAPWYALGTVVIGILLMAVASALRRRDRQTANPGNGICMGIRGGRLQRLPVNQLVPGDIVRIQAGEIVPADGRLTEAVNLVIQEELLTGISEPVVKDALQPDDPSVPQGKCGNRIFMNTSVIRGRGTFVVTKTGKNTQIGKARTIAGNQCHRGNSL